MFERMRSWYRNRPQQQNRGERSRTLLNVEWLEPRLLLAGDTYNWNPLNANNLLANNPANWQKMVNGNYVQQGANGTLPGQGGNSPNDTVYLNRNNQAINNAGIVWNQNFSFSTMNIINAYSGGQTINKGITVDVTGDNGNGAVNAGGALGGVLQIVFQDNTGVFHIEANSTINTISTLAAAGQTGGTLWINGGKTTFNTGAFQLNSQISGTLDVSDSTLVD